MRQERAAARSVAGVWLYAKHAEVTVPSLDDWEKGWNEKLREEMPMPGNIVSMVKLAA